MFGPPIRHRRIEFGMKPSKFAGEHHRNTHPMASQRDRRFAFRVSFPGDQKLPFNSAQLGQVQLSEASKIVVLTTEIYRFRLCVTALKWRQLNLKNTTTP